VSDEVLRLFVGVRVGAAAREALGRELAWLSGRDDALKVVREDDLHVTLQFLGGVPAARVGEISAALERAARLHAPEDVGYVGLGVFPDRRGGAARVLWAGVKEQRPGGLAALAADVGRELSPLGFRPEARAFTAHVTLARVRDGARAAAETLERVHRRQGHDFGPDRLSDLKLILSPSDRSRYAYKDLTSHPLGGTATERGSSG
jgi:2'-5' RNA ligase